MVFIGRILVYLIEPVGVLSRVGTQGGSEDLSHESLWASRALPLAWLCASNAQGLFLLPWFYRETV